MKLAIVILAVVAAASAQYNPGQYNPYTPKPFRSQYTTPRPYRPYVSSTPAPLVPFPAYAPTPIPAIARVVPVVKTGAGNANIVRYDNDIGPDGSYSYLYETDNGISAQEQGSLKSFGGNPPAASVVAQGSYSYTSPEGLPVVITYVADENGFQPSGDVLPKAPEIPAAILRSLAYIASRPPSKL